MRTAPIQDIFEEPTGLADELDEARRERQEGLRNLVSGGTISETERRAL